MTLQRRIDQLPPRMQRGSRVRRLLLTDGTTEEVAERLNRLLEPHAVVSSDDRWTPKGLDLTAEAKLGESLEFLSPDKREALIQWWLVVRQRANTPNWDLVCTGEIAGRRGLILVEAKAHDQGLSVAGKSANGNKLNHERIGEAIAEANADLNKLCPGWNLERDSHYQLANRFAWGWKPASLGVPVVLVYLGFLSAEEMQDQSMAFALHDCWEQAVKTHTQGIVPNEVWGKVLDVVWSPVSAADSFRSD